MESLQKYIILESEIIKSTYHNEIIMNGISKISKYISLELQNFENKINEMMDKGYQLNGSIVNIPFEYSDRYGTKFKGYKLIQSMVLNNINII